MPKLVYDSSVYIGMRITPARGSYVSAVVIQEMTAGANDAHEVRFWKAVQERAEREGRLLVPTGADWHFAGKVLNSLFRGGGRTAHGTVKISAGEQQRLVRDTLIARTAKRNGITVVTFNAADFAKIARFCKVNFIVPDNAKS